MVYVVEGNKEMQDNRLEVNGMRMLGECLKSSIKVRTSININVDRISKVASLAKKIIEKS